jgi:hypothetical protein
MTKLLPCSSATSSAGAGAIRPARADVLCIDCGNCWPDDCPDDCTPYCVGRIVTARGRAFVPIPGQEFYEGR